MTCKKHQPGRPCCNCNSTCFKCAGKCPNPCGIYISRSPIYGGICIPLNDLLQGLFLNGETVPHWPPETGDPYEPIGTGPFPQIPLADVDADCSIGGWGYGDPKYFGKPVETYNLGAFACDLHSFFNYKYHYGHGIITYVYKGPTTFGPYDLPVPEGCTLFVVEIRYFAVYIEYLAVPPFRKVYGSIYKELYTGVFCNCSELSNLQLELNYETEIQHPSGFAYGTSFGFWPFDKPVTPATVWVLTDCTSEDTDSLTLPLIARPDCSKRGAAVGIWDCGCTGRHIVRTCSEFGHCVERKYTTSKKVDFIDGTKQEVPTLGYCSTCPLYSAD